MLTIDENYIVNRLKAPSLDLIEIVGLYSAIIFSKDLFKRNADVCEFIKYTMNIDLPLYITKSRTMIVSRIIKIILNLNKEEQKMLKVSCIKYFELLVIKLPTEQKTEIKKKSKKKNENEKMAVWLKGLKNDR